MKEKTLLQEVYFDICDLLEGYSYKSIGYDSKNDFLNECKLKLELIEEVL